MSRTVITHIHKQLFLLSVHDLLVIRTKKKSVAFRRDVTFPTQIRKKDIIRILVFWDMILHHWVKVQNINILILENEDMTFYSNVGVHLPLMRSHIPEVCSCELECRVDQTLKFLKISNYFNLT